MEQLYKEQTMLATYSSLTAKKHNNSNAIFMISELIDNSIASWKQAKLSEPLEIRIVIDKRDGKSITVTDNANGMSVHELENSIRLDKYKEGDTINKFGIGLKNAAFWFGKDLEIWTCQNGNRTGLYTSVITSNKKGNEIIRWQVQDAPDFINRGTKIKISNIYSDRFFTAENFIKNTQSRLERKFWWYLLNNVTIKFHFINISTADEFVDLKPTSIKSQIIPDDKIEDFISCVEKSFKEPPELLHGIQDKLILLAKYKQPIEFVYELNVGSKGPFKFKFGVQEQTKDKEYRRHYGLGTLQQKRYINIPDENVIELGDYVRGDIKRMWGHVDFKDQFELDNNKRSFYFGEEEDAFNTLIEKLSKDLENVCHAVASVMRQSEKIRTGGRGVNTKLVETVLNRKVGTQVCKWKFESDKTATLLWDDIPIKIEEASYDKSENKPFISTHINQNDEIEIVFDKNHDILKPLINTATQSSVLQSFYPLFAVIGISSIIRDKQLNNISNYEKITDKREVNDYINIMDSILRKLVVN